MQQLPVYVAIEVTSEQGYLVRIWNLLFSIWPVFEAPHGFELFYCSQLSRFSK